ncbi:MAG TPA: winged helix-turn-helix domain-containing protein [Woeseiaceae bacterium]|nr:winged helix-turn-helix domain-containing protein [Woeseiaceae bacterium]
MKRSSPLPLGSAARRHEPDYALDDGFRIGDRNVRPREGLVESPGGNARVEPRAMAVLLCLAGAAGRVVSRDELVASVWGHAYVTDDALTRCISQLRRALGDDRRRPEFLETIPKRGYRLLAAVSPSGAIPAARAPAVLLVLPFQNLSGRDDDYLADGVTELLIARLSALPPLKVISRTTAMHYRSSARPLPEIAAEVGASHVIEGSVLRSSEQLQVVVQLIETATDTHLWAGSYTRSIGDLLIIENEISQAIAIELHGQLRGGESGTAAAAPALDPATLRDYLKGRYFFARRSDADVRKAISCFESVLSVQPDFAPALAGIAESFILLALYGTEPASTAFEQARATGARALAADPGCAEAHAALAGIAMFHDWDFSTAGEHARRALDLGPGYPMSHLIQGDLRVIRGDFIGAQNALGQALAMDPLNPGLNMNLGDFLMLERRYPEAVTALERALDLFPESAPMRYRLVLALALGGEHARAARELDTLAATADPVRQAEHATIVSGLAAHRDEARAGMKALLRLANERRVSPWAVARACAAAGAVDEAYAWLDRAIDERSSSVIFLAVAPLFDALRDDARFPARLRRIGLA